MYLLVDNVYVDSRLLKEKRYCNYEKCRGACCKGEGLGTPLSDIDIKRIDKNVSEPNFYEYNKGPRLVCRKNGDCIFLRDNMCKINHIKPDFCRLFPVRFERKDGFNFIIFHPYSECRFEESDKYYLERISDIIEREFGKNFTQKLLELCGNVYLQ